MPLIDKAYISLSKNNITHDPNIENNRDKINSDERARIYYTPGMSSFFMYLKTRKNNISFIGTMTECISYLNGKINYDCLNLRLSYPTTWPESKKKKLDELLAVEYVSEKDYKRMLMSYLLLLI